MAKKILKPYQFNVVSSSDEIGAMTDFVRIPGESLSEYKTRFLEDSRRPANSTYEGLINAINRNLGLDRIDEISVSLKKKSVFPVSPSVIVSQDVLTDNRLFAYVTDSEITIHLNQITFSQDTFVLDELKGMTLFLLGEEYLIIENNSTTITFEGEVSNIAVGTPFEIKPHWKQDSLVGLALESNTNSFVVISNNDHVLRVDSSQLHSIKNQKLFLVANRPRVHISSSRLFLYKDFVHDHNFQLDKVIDIKQNGLTQKEIISRINESDFFEGEDLMPHNVDVYAKTFKRQDSDTHVYSEPVPVSKFFKLKNKKVKEGSIKFSQEEIFFKETRDISSVNYGPYFYMNHKEGIVHAKKIPTDVEGTVSYIYKKFPFMIESSPVIITSFSDDDAQKFMFIQTEKRTYEDVREKYMSTQPKSDMIEYVAELLSQSKELWGE